MLNLIAFGIMVGVGLRFDLSASYYVLLTAEAILGMFAGFASFSQGTYFARGRVEIMASLSILGAAFVALTIGWLHGFWWGVGAFVLFWPMMYRLGVKVYIWFRGPTFLKFMDWANEPTSPSDQEQPSRRQEANQQTKSNANTAPTPAPKYSADDVFDDPKMLELVSEVVGYAFENGPHDFRAFIAEVVENLDPDLVKNIGPGIEWAWELVRKEADTSGRMTPAESVSAIVATVRNGGELNHKPVSRSEPTIHADCDTGANRIVACVQQTKSNNRWTGGKMHLVFPPLPPDLRGQSGAIFQSFVFTTGVGQEVALFLLDDPDFARELGSLKPFHLVAKCGAVETSAGMIAFILWSVSSANGHVVDYEQLLNPFNPDTIDLVAAAASQSRLKVAILDSVDSKTEGFLEFENNFGLDEFAPMLEEIARQESPADFQETRTAFFAEYTLEELKEA